jgi:hypothetical protein
MSQDANLSIQEPAEQGDVPRIGFEHRKLYLLEFQSYVPDKVQSAIIPNLDPMISIYLDKDSCSYLL